LQPWLPPCQATLVSGSGSDAVPGTAFTRLQPVTIPNPDLALLLYDSWPGQPTEIIQMATYRDVVCAVKQQDGFVPKTCWIAHVLELNGRTPHTAHNRIDPKVRQIPCPPEKRSAIERALRSFRMFKCRRNSLNVRILAPHSFYSICCIHGGVGGK